MHNINANEPGRACKERPAPPGPRMPGASRYIFFCAPSAGPRSRREPCATSKWSAAPHARERGYPTGSSSSSAAEKAAPWIDSWQHWVGARARAAEGPAAGATTNGVLAEGISCRRRVYDCGSPRTYSAQATRQFGVFTPSARVTLLQSHFPAHYPSPVSDPLGGYGDNARRRQHPRA